MVSSNCKLNNLLLFFFISLIGAALAFFTEANDYILSCLFCFTSIYSIALIWFYSGKRPTLFVLYMVSFNLFLGGRFFVYLFSQENDIFLLSWYTYFNPKGQERLLVYLFVYAYIVMSTIGCCVEWHKQRRVLFTPQLSAIESSKFDCILKKLFPVVVFCSLYYLYEGVQAILTYGYGTVAISDNVEQNVSYLAKFSSMSAGIFTGMAIAYGTKQTIKKYVSLLLITSLITLIMGSRGAFASMILFCLWLYSLYYNISIKKILLYGAAGLTILLLLFSLSVRADSYGITNMSSLEALTDFFYSNGGSLAIFGASMTIKDYPLLPYFQTFITGANFFYSKITGAVLKPEDISFQGHMCNTFDSDLFYSGAGLGWTVTGDLFLFSSGNILVYCILCFFIARFITYIDMSSFRSSFYRYMAASLSMGLFMMPRGSSAALFAMIPYIYIYFFLLKYLTRFVSRG